MSPTPTSRLSLSHSHLHHVTRSCSYRVASYAARRAGLPGPGRPPSADGAASRSVRLQPCDTLRRPCRGPCAAQTKRQHRDVPRVRQHSTPRHEPWRARRRYAATIGALTARNEKLVAANTNLATTISALSAENSKLAAQCGAVVDATSEALRQEGTARTHVSALSSLCEQVEQFCVSRA